MAATATARFTKRSMASFLLLTLNHALAALVPPPSVLSTDAFKRVNPKSDRFDVLGFHHVELYCSDATAPPDGSRTRSAWTCSRRVATVASPRSRSVRAT